MNKEEFVQFLKSVGGLKDDHKEGIIIEDSEFFAIGDGWLESIKRLIEDLIKMGWNKEVCQVKEKFGGGRFYINEGSIEIYDRIWKWEQETFKTCETCGQPGILRRGSWLLTLCDTCNKPKK